MIDLCQIKIKWPLPMKKTTLQQKQVNLISMIVYWYKPSNDRKSFNIHAFLFRMIMRLACLRPIWFWIRSERKTSCLASKTKQQNWLRCNVKPVRGIRLHSNCGNVNVHWAVCWMSAVAELTVLLLVSSSFVFTVFSARHFHSRMKTNMNLNWKSRETR